MTGVLVRRPCEDTYQEEAMWRSGVGCREGPRQWHSRWKFVGASLARLRNKWKPRAAREVSDEKNSKK
mgnify:CR=1 FL=1